MLRVALISLGALGLLAPASAAQEAGDGQDAPASAETSAEPTPPDQGPVIGRSALDLPGTASVEAPPATLYPRLLPPEDRRGEAFADRVSISPDGRRLAVGTQQRDRFEVQIVGVTRKATERRLRGRGTLAWVGWADDDTVLVGTRARGEALATAYSVSMGRTRTLGEAEGVAAVREDGQVILAREGDAPRCAGGQTPPETAPEAAGSLPLRPAGPPDDKGRLMLRGDEADRTVLYPFDCAAGALGAPLYDGPAISGVIVNPALRTYHGVVTADGPRYADPSLAYEMEEVAAAFPEPVDVYPIETSRSPNTLLLYVVGDTVPGGYYVLDRYAGDLDLHVTYRSDGSTTTE